MSKPNSDPSPAPQLHPDKHNTEARTGSGMTIQSEDDFKAQRLQLVFEAYRVLSNPEARLAYIAQRSHSGHRAATKACSMRN